MTTPVTTGPEAAGATLHLGGTAWCTPDLAPLLVPIDQLTPFPGNARRGDQDAITSSVRDLGVWRAHVVQQSTGHVMVGNHQLRALLDLGATHAPASYRDTTDDLARAIALRDNRTSDLGGYDDAALLDLYRATDQTVGLEVAGLTAADMADLERALAGPPETRTDADDVPPVPTTPISHAGDLWDLGRHRLVVGDARDEQAYGSLLVGESPVCVWTDPPYGVAVLGKSRALPRGKRISMGGQTIQNDRLSPAALREMVDLTLARINDVCAPGSPIYMAAPGGPLTLVFGNALADLSMLRQTIVWGKDSMVLGRSDYHYRHELIWFGYTPGGDGRRGRGGANWYGPNNETTLHEIPRPKRSDEHPTMKPVELVARALRNSTRPGDVVLDPFAGSGTTLIACHQEDRTARLIELDPRYADVICRRYQQHTGTLPVRNGIQVDFTQDAAA